MDLSIKGKNAIVCASSQGLGKQAAVDLAKEGVNLAICSRNKNKIELVKDEIEKISDDENRIIEKFIPQFNLAISPETAFQMKLLLRGVVTNGTAKLAKNINQFVAGKTGTTNKYKDAWFVGFSNDLSAN